MILSKLSEKSSQSSSPSFLNLIKVDDFFESSLNSEGKVEKLGIKGMKSNEEKSMFQ